MAALDDCHNIFDLRDAARRRLPKGVFEFVDRATEDHIAVRENRQAFEDIKLLFRALVDVSGRSTQTTLFGKPMGFPLAIAPTGAAGLCWYRGELALAKAAAKANVPLTLSTASMTAMETIADQAGGRLWFQLYVWKRRDLSYQIINRAKAAGYEALIVTVNSAVSPNREYNAKNGFGVPFNASARFLKDIALHPSWTLGVMGRYLTTIGMPRHENYPDEFQHHITSGGGAVKNDGMDRDSLNWDDLARFREMWPGVLMLKGVAREDDAVKALQYGIDGIVVSNHGGRNMDSSVSTLGALPRIADAVGDKLTLILDSGVRRGSDIVKAMALGAKAVLTGRATLYGTAVGGQAGAEKALDILRVEMDKTMAYTGCNRVEDITTDIFFNPDGRNRR